MSNNPIKTMNPEFMKGLKSSGYVQKICHDFEKGNHTLFAKEKRLSLISDYDFDSLDSIPTIQSKNPKFATTDVINKVKERLRHLNVAVGDKLDSNGSDKRNCKVRSFINGIENGLEWSHGSEKVETKITNNISLKFHKSQHNYGDDWSSRRKSYGFEQVQKQTGLQTVSKDSSTDSGICHSSDLISTPKNEIESYFQKRSQQANCDFKDSKTKKIEFLKTEGHFAKLNFGESKHNRRYDNNPVEWSSIVTPNRKHPHNGKTQLKRSSWALADRNQSSQHFNKVDVTERNDHVSDSSSLTWPKNHKESDKVFINKGLLVRIGANETCDPPNVVKLPRVSLKSTGLIKNTLLMTQRNLYSPPTQTISPFLSQQSSALHLNYIDDKYEDEIADREVQLILSNCADFKYYDPDDLRSPKDFQSPVAPIPLKSKKPNMDKQYAKKMGIEDELSKAADEIYQVANQFTQKTTRSPSSDDCNRFNLNSRNKQFSQDEPTRDYNVAHRKPVNIRKKLVNTHNIRSRRLQIANSRDILLSSSEDLTSKELEPKIRKPPRKSKSKIFENSIKDASNTNFMKATISSRLHANMITATTRNRF